jgi:Flavoprotein
MTTTATTAGKGRRRRPRILLGVTGSVAAVKAPEIAVRLCRECDADVKILLTRGGENFWTKAESYDPINWNELMKHLQKAVAATSISLSSSAAASAANENVDNGGDENVGIPRMDLIRTYATKLMATTCIEIVAS